MITHYEPPQIDAGIVIRPMAVGEKEAVLRCIRRSFPRLQRLFFSFTPHVFVAQLEENIIGAAVVKTILSGGVKKGIFSWLCTDPIYRQRGVASLLNDACISFFEAEGCREIWASVEGDNTGATKGLTAHGFSLVSIEEQVRRYRLGSLRLWISLLHVIDFGHFLWVRPAPEPLKQKTNLWVGNLLANAILGGIAYSLQGGISRFLPIFIAISLIFCLREGVMRLIAGLMRMPVCFRPWESVAPASFVLALTGRFFPMPGGIYPNINGWSYERFRRKLGLIALGGSWSVVALGWCTGLLHLHRTLPPMVDNVFEAIALVGTIVAIFDIALPFFPFRCYNGYRIWRLHPVIWLLSASAAILMLRFLR